MGNRIYRWLSGRAIAAAVIVFVSGIAAGPVAAHTGGGSHHGGWMGLHGGGLGILWIVLLAVVLIGVVLGLGSLLFRQGADGDADEALGRLRQRYADGEIDDEEFETRRRKLDRE